MADRDESDKLDLPEPFDFALDTASFAGWTARFPGIATVPPDSRGNYAGVTIGSLRLRAVSPLPSALLSLMTSR